MPSLGTLKSLSKALNTHAPTLTVPLPEDLTDAVESYLQKHEKHDESNSERLQEELLSIHSRHIAGYPERLSGFIALLSRLLPVIRTPSRILQWWDLLQDGFGEALSTERGLMRESLSALLELLSQDELYLGEEGTIPAVNPFVERSISTWLEHWQGPSLRGPADHVEKVVRDGLVFYGKRKPKDFLTVLDTFFVKAEYRMRTATLLCEFIQTQPPHLYQVLDTPLFNNLLRCLQLDSSTTVVSLTLTALTMLLPYSPSSLVPHLPTLFNIYARLLFWHRQHHAEPTEFSNEQAYPKPLVDPTGWDTCAFSSDFDGHDIPSLRNYFTILYGLYPINFMDYIRKPHRYLRHANDPNADTVEVQPSEIRHKSEEFRRCHLLHPNFYHLTIESEKTDYTRWQASEPAEVVAECTALCVTEGQLGPKQTEVVQGTHRRSSVFSKEGSNSSIRDFPLLRVVQTDDGTKSGEVSDVDATDPLSRSAAGGDSPTSAPQTTASPSQAQVQELMHSNKVIKSGLHQSPTNDSVALLSLNQQEPAARETSGMSAQPASRPRAESSLSKTEESSQVAQLRGQVLLLQNDLSFERYLKQQHIAHMGELRRREVKESASEAEMQNLINANRNLKVRFEEAKKAEMQVKKESEKSRSLAKKWEADLSTKLKALREEAKKTKARVEELERELEMTKSECDELKRRLCAYEVRELNWEQNVQSYEVDKAEMDRLKSELGRLTATEREFQAREADMKQALEVAAAAENQIAVLNAKLDAQDKELNQTKEAYEAQIAALKAKLMKREDDESSKRLSASENRAIEAALSASRAKQTELQRHYDLLMRKYTALQSALFEMECGSPTGTEQPRGSGGMEEKTTSGSSSPVQERRGSQRVFSSPEPFETMAPFNATPPLAGKSGTAAAGPSESAPSLPATTPSPEPRFHGRGGVGNRVRKEGKEKKEGDKKKMGGLRGMKNFQVH